MQRRLLFSMLAVAVAAVLLLGIPLGFVLGRQQISDVHTQLERDAVTLARGLQERATSGLPVGAAQLARSLSDQYVVIKQGGLAPVSVGRKPPPSGAVSATATSGTFTVTVAANGSLVTGKIYRALLMIAGLAVAGLAVAVVLALLVARRLARPMRDLAAAADRLGSGDARSLGRRYGIPELDRVAEELDGSAQRISGLLSAEREFAADASHQLRSPLTALSMRLEEMISRADDAAIVREEGAAALAQTERLAEVVSQLLGRARRSVAGNPEVVGIDEIVAQQVIEWEPAFRRANRKLEVIGEKGLRAWATPGGAAQVIATLLDNALAHGGGTVTVRTSGTRRSVVVEVRDEGKGVPPELAGRIFDRNVSGEPGGTGLGLSLARAVAAADGGQVILVRARPAVFALFLPHVSGSGVEQPAVAGPALPGPVG